MNKIVKIYCEGKKGSHDFEILSNFLPNEFIKIEPIGSKIGAKSIIQFLEQNSVDKSNYYIFFRDRDFDKEIPENVCLESDHYVYFTYFNTIENYLLYDIHVFFDFICNKDLKLKYKIDKIEDVKKVYIDAANKIKFFQAVRHTMGKLRTNKTNFGSNFMENSGELPKDLSSEFCLKAGFDKVNNSKTFTDSWNNNDFNTIYNEFLNKFDSNFIENLDFLIYFQGKDFASSLKLSLPEFPLNDFYKYAKKQFDYTKFNDLVSLRELLSKQI